MSLCKTQFQAFLGKVNSFVYFNISLFFLFFFSFSTPWHFYWIHDTQNCWLEKRKKHQLERKRKGKKKLKLKRTNKMIWIFFFSDRGRKLINCFRNEKLEVQLKLEMFCSTKIVLVIGQGCICFQIIFTLYLYGSATLHSGLLHLINPNADGQL